MTLYHLCQQHRVCPKSRYVLRITGSVHRCIAVYDYHAWMTDAYGRSLPPVMLADFWRYYDRAPREIPLSKRATGSRCGKVWNGEVSKYGINRRAI